MGVRVAWPTLYAFVGIVLHSAVVNLFGRCFVLRRLKVWLKSIISLYTDEGSLISSRIDGCVPRALDARRHLSWTDTTLLSSSAGIAEALLVADPGQHLLLLFTTLWHLVTF